MTADEIARLRELAEGSSEKWDCYAWDVGHVFTIDPPTLLRFLDGWDALIEYVEWAEAVDACVFSTDAERDDAVESRASARARLRALGLIGGDQ